MATTIKPFPHYQINVKDNSIYTVEYTTILPVHRPLWLIPAAEGPVNDPVWCPNYQAAVATFGKATFTNTSRYFSPQAKILKDTLTYNGAFICRLAGGDAKTAFVVLEAWVRQAHVPNWVRDEDGNFVIDSNTGGRKLPVTTLDGDGNRYDEEGRLVVTEDGDLPLGYDPRVLDGVEIQYRTRTIQRDGDLEGGYASIGKRITTNGYTIYPIMVFSALYPGYYGNDLGFGIGWRNDSDNSTGNVEYYKSMFYTIAPFRRDEGKTSVTPVRDIYNRVETSFAARPDAINLSTGLEMSLQAIASRTYDDETHQLPYTIFTYEENIDAIARFFLQHTDETISGYIEDEFCVECEEGGSVAAEAITGPGMETRGVRNEFGGYVINIFTGRNTKNIAYKYLNILTPENAPSADELGDSAKSEAVSLSIAGRIYLGGGEDGAEFDNSDTSGTAPLINELVTASGSFNDVLFQDLMVKFLSLSTNRTIIDPFRYPFTHIYDIGYNMEVKKAMLDFLDIRDDVVVELSTQELWGDNTGRPIELNDEADDVANGETLREEALLHRESILKGTECCRCVIYAHAGFLVDNTFTKPLPIGTYWSAMKHAQLGNLPYMNPREPRGWPDSYNEFFKVNSINWINYDPELQSRVWNGGINYIQWADMSRVFYPALRTVYREDTSVLSDQWFVDAVVYTKHVVRTAWGRYTGRNDRVAVLQRAIKEYLDAQLAALYSGKYDFEVSVYQTAEEQKIGYIQHVLIRITSPATMRVMDVDIEVNREGYNPEEE